MTSDTPSVMAPASSRVHTARQGSPQEGARRRRTEILAGFGGRPFTAEAALTAGLTRDDLRSSAVRRLGRGVFVDARTPMSLALRVAAVLLTAPEGAHAASVTAAHLQGLPAPATDRLHVSIPRGARWRHEDIVIMRHGSSRAFVTQTPVGPVPLTLPADVLGEVIDRMPLLDAVVLADAVLARHAALTQEITAGWAADPRCRRVGRLADGRAESPMETRLRLLLVLAGLPAPAPQHRVLIEGVSRRFDLAYPEHKIAIEYDGEHHFMSDAAKHADAIRREAVARAGWATVGVVSRGIYADPAGTLERVVRQLAARGVHVVVSPAWQVHFTQRGRAA